MNYKIIPGFSRYAITSDGTVRNVHTQKILTPHFNRGGYLQIGIKSDQGNKAVKRIHRLVLLSFVGPCPDGCEGDHKNRIRSDNRLDNLRYATISKGRQNMLTSLGESKFKGVFVRKGMKLSRPWRAKTEVNGRQLWSQYVASAKEAALLYDAMALKYFGPLALTNKSLGLL